MTAQAETHRFEAKVREVLDLVIHSLYTHKEIFLRELISNASDALDKLRVLALQDQALLPPGEELGIALEVDREARVLRVADNGIGMSREELQQNLGTIASSGTRRFLETLEHSGSAERPELIGQFGVGFYSVFMVADQVVVETRKAGEQTGWRWTSAGTGEYTIESAADLARGTVVSLHLREESADSEDGGKPVDFLSEWTLRDVVRRYSDFVEYPIQMQVVRSRPKLDEEKKPIEGETEETQELETLNSRRPLWSRPKAEIQESEYKEFYRHLTHDWNEPLETIHFRVEGTLEYTALLYLPSDRQQDIFDPARNKSNLSLYVKRVLIQEECEELLPAWLRFVRGIVECSDLPLNVSRETLQESPKLGQIRRRLEKKVLEVLAGLLEDDRARYERFWKSFGVVLKEGIWFGGDSDERVSKLCLFDSSRGEARTTLGEYVGRMLDGQDAIWVLTAPNLATAASSPHLEAFKARGHEVLFLVDPVDEWVLQRLPRFDGHPVRRIDQGDVELGGDEERAAREAEEKEHEGLLGALTEALGEAVKAVRFSSRLKESAAVLVSDAHGLSGHMQRLLARSGQDVPDDARTLELNPGHPIIAGLERVYAADPTSPRLAEYAELLLDQALISEGAPPRDAARFTRLVARLMGDAVG